MQNNLIISTLEWIKTAQARGVTDRLMIITDMNERLLRGMGMFPALEEDHNVICSGNSTLVPVTAVKVNRGEEKMFKKIL